MAEEDFTTKFGRAMRKTSIHLIVVALGGLIVSVLIIRKPVLSGERSHDFGDVEIADANVSVKHTFHLTNATGKPIDIRFMKPDCGCTTVSASTMHILPDAQVDISVTLEISRHGVKKSVVSLDLGDAGMQTLSVQAVGKMKLRLFSPMEKIVFTPDMRTGNTPPVTVSVFATVFGSTAPPSSLTPTGPPGVVVQFSGWSLNHESKDPSAGATEWEGQVVVRREESELPPNSELKIACDGAASTLAIPIILAQSLTGSDVSQPIKRPATAPE